MSKRSTTGQPKVGASVAKPEEKPKGVLQQALLREHQTRHEREAAVQRLVILGTVIAIGIAAVILVGALIVDQFIRPNQIVATVNGTPISVAQFQARARLERALLSEQLNQSIALMSGFGMSSDQIVQQLQSQPPYSTWLSELSVPDQLGNRILNEMVDDELVRQKAAELGISVTDEEVQQEIYDYFGYNPNESSVEPTATPTQTPSPTPVVSPTPSQVPTATLTPPPSPTPEVEPTATLTPVPSATPSSTPNPTERADQFAENRETYYSSLRSTARISDEQIRSYFEMKALRKKVRDAVLSDITQTDTFVNARHILVASEAEAQQAIDAINAGESFASVAAAMSTDGSASSGGGLGWAQPSGYVTEFADAVTDAPIGEIIGPVQTQFGYHIIQVMGREERSITDAEYETKLDDEFTTYLETLRDDPATVVVINDIWADNVPEEPNFVARGL